MPKGTLFWVVYIILLILCLVISWPLTWGSAPFLALFILTGLLGWGVYGKIVQ
jgi:hypothetical protein